MTFVHELQCGHINFVLLLEKNKTKSKKESTRRVSGE
jgi:hypothetical protein